MNEFQRLVAFMKIQAHNFSTMHRHLAGDSAWLENHEELAGWGEKIGEQVDDLAEIGIALGYQEPGIKDAVLAFGGDLLDIQPRDRDDTFRRAQGCMRAISGMMQAAEAIVPANVANRLQEYEYYWDKESGYKLAMMLGDRAGGRRMEEEDDD